MFQVEQIIKIKLENPSFLYLVKEVKKIGVVASKFFVSEGEEYYFGENNFEIKLDPIYSKIEVNKLVNKDGFANILLLHQKGETNFITFCKQAAEVGVYYWVVDLIKMNVIYYDTYGNIILEELIPQS